MKRGVGAKGLVRARTNEALERSRAKRGYRSRTKDVCIRVGVRRGIGNGSPSSSSRDGTGRGNRRSPEDDGVCRLVASLMQHDAIPADLTTCSAPGLENRGRRFTRPFAVLDHVNFSHIDPSVLSK